MAHKKLDVWKKSIELTVEIYKITQEFPNNEIYGITNQMRRCAVSIPSNIAEGCARQSSKETVQFLHIALGSAAELETQLIIANKLGYISKIDNLLLTSIRGLLLGLIKYYQGKIQK